MKKIIATVAVSAAALFGVVACSTAMEDEPGTPETVTETQAPEEENPIKFTATDAGTVTDYDGSPYTIVEVTVDNGSDYETTSVNSLDFSAELADGSVAATDAFFVDLENPLEAVDVGPGQKVSGQLAVAGDVDVAKVQWANDIFSHEKETAEVK